jgi:hypothetical protein
MATFDERAIAIANALVNGTASAPLRNRLGMALAIWRARGPEYEAGNASEKSQIAIECMRDVLIGIVKHTEGTDASNTAQAIVEADFAQTLPKP